MKAVGAWIQNSLIGEPDRAVDLMKRGGFNSASLVTNDFSKNRGPTEYWTRDLARLANMADACHAAGIEVTLTTWVMPHDVFVDGMLEQLPEIIDATGATRLYLDAEEPWNAATGEFDREVAAWEIGSGLGDIVELALSAIVYCPEVEILPLAGICPVYSPQAYSTIANDLDPHTGVTKARDRWVAKFGEPECWSMGLAAYKLPIPPDPYMQPPIDQCRALEIEDVCYWDLGQAADDEDRLDFIASLTDPPTVAAPGIFAPLELEALPSSVFSRGVLIVQHLLTAQGFDPGPFDGLPGAKTLAAVQSFQLARRLAPTGVVDYGTWGWLVSG